MAAIFRRKVRSYGGTIQVSSSRELIFFASSMLNCHSNMVELSDLSKGVGELLTVTKQKDDIGDSHTVIQELLGELANSPY